MSNLIKLRNSVTASAAPTALERGELGVNIEDRKVWVGDAAKRPVLLLDSYSTPVIKASFRGTIAGGVLTRTSNRNMTVVRTKVGTFTVTAVGMNGEDILLVDPFSTFVAEVSDWASGTRTVEVFNTGFMARSLADPSHIHFLLLGVP